MKSIYKRRSIRKYQKDPVDEKLLSECIKAGMNAPSARNQQVWHFVLVQDREMLDKIPTVHPYASMIKEAPAAILVCADLPVEKSKDYWVQDLGACTQNILLMATELGLATVWLGVHPRQDRVDGLRKLFKLPEQVMPYSLIPIGYGDEKKQENNNFIEERIHNDVW